MMPIPKHLRHLYRGPLYRAFVTALLDRAGNACEICKAPHRTRVFRVRLPQYKGWWWSETSGFGHDPEGIVRPFPTMLDLLDKYPGLKWRGVKIKVGPSHLHGYPPGDLDLTHSRALCQWHHLAYDLSFHVANSRTTRQTRKDGARPLLGELDGPGSEKGAS